MAFIKTEIFNEKQYVFKLTRAAQCEIEEIQNKQNMKLMQDEEIIALMSNSSKYQKVLEEIEKIENEEEKQQAMVEFLSQNTSLLSKVDKIEAVDSIELYELGYILLKNYKNNPPISKEEYEQITTQIEDRLGYLGAVEFFVEMRDEVFMEMGQINKTMKKQRMSVPKQVMN